MPTSVTILTGPTGSGKSSRVAAWCADRTDVSGILQRAQAGGRALVALSSDETVALESLDPAEPAITVGRFRFRRAAFDWANAHLAAIAPDPAWSFVVLDELGPLELEGDGMASGARAVLAHSPGAVILLVRERLADAVVRAFAPGAQVMAAEDWPHSVQAPISAP